MKFIHMADCHIGAWRDPKMRVLTHQAFEKAVTKCLNENPDFIIISGDLFNTAIPDVDSLKEAVKQLTRIKKRMIPVYIIAGSHDYSASGKSMLEVLEEAGLVTNVCKGHVKEGKLLLAFTTDKATGVKLTGVLGKKGGLDREYYEDLDRELLENEPGEKIFLFHTSITEMKPKELEKMESYSLSFMPKNFKYYAGGHVHIINEIGMEGYDLVVYPGPLFPASFSELEKLGAGGICIVEDWKLRREPILAKERITIKINADKRTPGEINNELKVPDCKDKIVLLRVEGELREGSPTEIEFKRFFDDCYKKGAYFVMKNTAKLTSREYEEIMISQDTENIEETIIKENAGQSWMDPETEKKLVSMLINTLSSEQQDGEKKYEYEKRVSEEAEKILLGLPNNTT